MSSGNDYNEEVWEEMARRDGETWEEITRLRRAITELRAAIRELSERIEALGCTTTTISDEQAQAIGRLLGGEEEQGGQR